GRPPRKVRRLRLQGGGGSRQCSRPPGDHPAPARPRPHAVDLPLQRPRFPPDGRLRQCDQGHPGVSGSAHSRRSRAMRFATVIVFLIVALLPQPACAADESIWIEAEHLQGVRGYCWPGGLKAKTDGHWAVSGPGWAAEWIQGGESNRETRSKA